MEILARQLVAGRADLSSALSEIARVTATNISHLANHLPLLDGTSLT